MMPKQIHSQPTADLPPGAEPAATTSRRHRVSRRELFTGVWAPRITRRRAALGRAVSRPFATNRSQNAGRNQREPARKGSQR